MALGLRSPLDHRDKTQNFSVQKARPNTGMHLINKIVVHFRDLYCAVTVLLCALARKRAFMCDSPNESDKKHVVHCAPVMESDFVPPPRMRHNSIASFRAGFSPQPSLFI